MLSFMDAFRLMGLLFVCLLPFLLLMKTPRAGRGPASIH
jgi:hypothetical protein